MAFNPTIWRPIAIILSIVNIGGVIQAFAVGEPMHAMGHVVLGVGLAFWVRRLNERARAARGDRITGSDQQVQIEGLESDLDQMRRELAETQERLDFTERMLAQRRSATPSQHPSPPSGSAVR